MQLQDQSLPIVPGRLPPCAARCAATKARGRSGLTPGSSSGGSRAGNGMWSSDSEWSRASLRSSATKPPAAAPSQIHFRPTEPSKRPAPPRTPNRHARRPPPVTRMASSSRTSRSASRSRLQIFNSPASSSTSSPASKSPRGTCHRSPCPRSNPTSRRHVNLTGNA